VALKPELDKLAIRLDALEAEYDKGWKAELLSDGSMRYSARM
jgi:hypothetical protein